MTATTALWVHGALMGLVGMYALSKERQELGCSGHGTTRRQCRDEDSVYVRGTAPSPGDTGREARSKLVSILSYHEKGGVWKRCFILATVLAYLCYLIRRATTSPGWAIATTHLVFLSVLYFYWNFLNYHHFRVLKRHGVALIGLIAREGGRRG